MGPCEAYSSALSGGHGSCLEYIQWGHVELAANGYDLTIFSGNRLDALFFDTLALPASLIMVLKVSVSESLCTRSVFLSLG